MQQFWRSTEDVISTYLACCGFTRRLEGGAAASRRAINSIVNSAIIYLYIIYLYLYNIYILYIYIYLFIYIHSVDIYTYIIFTIGAQKTSGDQTIWNRARVLYGIKSVKPYVSSWHFFSSLVYHLDLPQDLLQALLCKPVAFSSRASSSVDIFEKSMFSLQVLCTSARPVARVDEDQALLGTLCDICFNRRRLTTDDL